MCWMYCVDSVWLILRLRLAVLVLPGFFGTLLVARVLLLVLLFALGFACWLIALI